ncbi:hypothetical protein [Aquamicrobium soli]|jgi:hypothetical protein|uniref:Uncharacterized protein n=1 Tax=Aquamicrobium soli TaxID=1811518 RepID=A0ABV7K963_9HYPH
MLADEALLAPRFVSAMVVPDVAAGALPADAPKSRIEVVVRCDGRTIVSGGVEMDAVLSSREASEALK